MDQTPTAVPRYHTCEYCKLASLDLAGTQPKYRELVPRYFWSGQEVAILRLPIKEARKAREAGCELFKNTRSFGESSSRDKLLDIDWHLPQDDHIEVSVAKSYRSPTGMLFYTSKPSGAIKGHSTDAWEIFALPGSPASKCFLPAAKNLDPRSVGSLNFARKCLSECLRTHKKCKQTRKLLQPSRFLDTNSPSHDHDTVTLVALGERVPYAALSYCWGGDVGLKTTIATLSQAQTGLKLTDIPKTIREAIFVARELGLRYLWVDRLCIVQDNSDDFSLEINKMHDIYAGAQITISAASALASQDGFLHPRSRSTSVSIPAQPINTRGWILQESVLSPRLLVYGSHQLEWSCRTASKTDGGHPSHPHLVGDPKWNVLITWKQLITNYTERDLSCPTDKLIAISAIARQANATLEDDYLAGMWRRHNLAGQLLWRCKLNHPESKGLSKDYVAPSWSWASFDGPVDYYRWNDGKKAITTMKLLRWEIVPTSPGSPYGAVTSGSLHIRGRAMDIL
ncbi:HET-domain-containing protein [Stipitochalara longipes BDJ]|nr:HET-domain-containing protein [Stipitochalara longipes BDJ]